MKQKFRDALAAIGLPEVDYIDTTLSFVAHRLVERGLGIALIEPSIPFEFGLLAPERRASSKYVREIREIASETLEEMRQTLGIDFTFDVTHTSE